MSVPIKPSNEKLVSQITGSKSFQRSKSVVLNPMPALAVAAGTPKFLSHDLPLLTIRGVLQWPHERVKAPNVCNINHRRPTFPTNNIISTIMVILHPFSWGWRGPQCRGHVPQWYQLLEILKKSNPPFQVAIPSTESTRIGATNALRISFTISPHLILQI